MSVEVEGPDQVECQGVLEVEIRPNYWKPLVALLATSGLRISEALGLRRRDLDLSAGTVTVRQTVVEVDGRMIVTTPKSRASRRTVKLIPLCRRDAQGPGVTA